MTAIPFLERRQRVLRASSRPLRASFELALAWVARRLARRETRPWFLLDERLLRDIGMSPRDAEIARRQSGEGETGGWEPLAAHGLDSAEMLRWVREGRRGRF